jgi:hypothetical protein
MPDGLLNDYIADSLNKSQSSYIPGKYDGKMVIFRSPKIFEDPTLGWSSLVAGGIETFDIPGEHINRAYVMHDPFVQFIAEELKNYKSKIESPQ